MLKGAGIEKADAFASVTNYDSTNLMASETAQTLYRVPRVVARLYNPEAELTFRRMGIYYVCGTSLLVERLYRKVTQKEMMVQHVDDEAGVRITSSPCRPPLPESPLLA